MSAFPDREAEQGSLQRPRLRSFNGFENLLNERPVLTITFAIANGGFVGESHLSDGQVATTIPLSNESRLAAPLS
jgi:hypothetical protein